MSKKEAKFTAKGDVKLRLSSAQYEDFLTFLDWLPMNQRNSYSTPAQLLWNIVTQRIKDRFTMAPYFAGQEQSVTLRIEEAVIVKEMFAHAPEHARGILAGVMMQVDQIVMSHA